MDAETASDRYEKTEELTTLWKNLFTEVRRGHIKPDAFADGMIQFLSD